MTELVGKEKVGQLCPSTETEAIQDKAGIN